MYVSSRQGYKPPVKSTGRGDKDSHFASLKYCNGAEAFYTYDPQFGKAGGQMAHTNTYGTDTGKNSSLPMSRMKMEKFLLKQCGMQLMLQWKLAALSIILKA